MILLYHLVFPDDTPAATWNAGMVLRLRNFKRQLLWMNRFFQIVPLDEYVSQYRKKGTPPRRLVALTFDDCYSRTFELVTPFLEQQNLPAVFFSNTSHLVDGCLLWFVYFNALCSEQVYAEIEIDGLSYSLTTRQSSQIAWQHLINLARKSADARVFASQFSQKYPLPPEVIAKYQGLSEDQLGQIGASSLFATGGHTHSHPFLDQITPSELLAELLSNKEMLEKSTGKPVVHFAYTGGVYNAESIQAIKTAGFQDAFAIKSRNLTKDAYFEIPRTDIYSPSLLKFTLKTSRSLLN